MPTNVDNFLEWLKSDPLELAKLVGVIQKWHAAQTPNVPEGTGEGPRTWRAGEDVTLTTKGLSDAELDALNKGMAEAQVKETAIKMVAMFISGLLARGI